MWVEMSGLPLGFVTSQVILFARMWVEILNVSASFITSCRHPLHEDVSWNTTFRFTIRSCTVVILFARMWVEIYSSTVTSRPSSVILFARMWVEISQGSYVTAIFSVILFVRMWVEISLPMRPKSRRKASSSLWGCELKYKLFQWNIRCAGHPPCEDVSWNSKMNINYGLIEVILLVRMWVEMNY